MTNTSNPTHYRLTPTRAHCDAYPDFHLAGADGNHFASVQDAATASLDLGDDIAWEVVEVDGEMLGNVG
jgi:hypothetical protein